MPGMPQPRPSYALPTASCFSRASRPAVSRWVGLEWTAGAETSAHGLCCPVSAALLLPWPCAHSALSSACVCPPGMPSWLTPQYFRVDYDPSCSRGSKAWFFLQVLCESQFTSYLCGLMKLAIL